MHTIRRQLRDIEILKVTMMNDFLKMVFKRASEVKL